MAISQADVETVLSELVAQKPLSIIKLSQTISSEAAQNGEKRSSGASDASANVMENASPASLVVELAHYKELFSKLRFSYVEQVTKEKFLRSIVDDPPLYVEHQQNVELEAELVGLKETLQEHKAEVANIVEELEGRGRQLSQRYEQIELDKAQLSTLPDSIANLENTITTLRASQAPQSSNPSLSLPLHATLAQLSAKEAELAALDRQLATLHAAVPRKTNELERLERELRPLEAQKSGAVAAAIEAKRRKEESERGGTGDQLEMKGRWYRAVETGLKEILDVQG